MSLNFMEPTFPQQHHCRTIPTTVKIQRMHYGTFNYALVIHEVVVLAVDYCPFCGTDLHVEALENDRKQVSNQESMPQTRSSLT